MDSCAAFDQRRLFCCTMQGNRATIQELVQGRDIIFKRLSKSDDSMSAATAQYGQYVVKDGPFANPAIWVAASKMPAWKWWLVHGGLTPDLQVSLSCLLCYESELSSIFKSSIGCFSTCFLVRSL